MATPISMNLYLYLALKKFDFIDVKICLIRNHQQDLLNC